jgi:hypothetical protein
VKTRIVAAANAKKKGTKSASTSRPPLRRTRTPFEARASQADLLFSKQMKDCDEKLMVRQPSN